MNNSAFLGRADEDLACIPPEDGGDS